MEYGIIGQQMGRGCQSAIFKMSGAAVCDGAERSGSTVMQEGRWSLYTIMGTGKGEGETVVDRELTPQRRARRGYPE